MQAAQEMRALTALLLELVTVQEVCLAAGDGFLKRAQEMPRTLAAIAPIQNSMLADWWEHATCSQAKTATKQQPRN